MRTTSVSRRVGLVSCLVGMSAVARANEPFQTYPDCSQGPLSEIAVCDRTLSEADRAAALVAALTDEEKLDNLVRYVVLSSVWGV